LIAIQRYSSVVFILKASQSILWTTTRVIEPRALAVALKYRLAKTLGLEYVVSCACVLQSKSLNGAVERSVRYGWGTLNGPVGRNVRRECGILLNGD
jgi:hypothetical protein